VDTYWANVLVIWLMTAFLALTLQLDALSRMLRWAAEFTDRFKFPGKREGA